MDTLRDEYFSPADAEEWQEFSEGLEPEGEEELDAYLIALHSYYGNQRCG